jgi:hypothetical protein
MLSSAVLEAVRATSSVLHLHNLPFALRFDLIHVLEYENQARNGRPVVLRVSASFHVVFGGVRGSARYFERAASPQPPIRLAF